MGIEERIEQKLDDLLKEHSDLRVDVKGVSTKMDILVGPDGNNGTISEFKERLASLESRKDRAAGFFGAIGLVVGAFTHWAGDHLVSFFRGH